MRAISARDLTGALLVAGLILGGAALGPTADAQSSPPIPGTGVVTVQGPYTVDQIFPSYVPGTAVTDAPGPVSLTIGPERRVTTDGWCLDYQGSRAQAASGDEASCYGGNPYPAPPATRATDDDRG